MFWPTFRARFPGARIEIDRGARVTVYLAGVAIGTGPTATDAVADALVKLRAVKA